MADKVFAAERTRQAIAAAERGDIPDARELLAEALTLDPDYTPAWLWFAAVTEDKGEEKFCLGKVRDLDPEHRAIPALNRLGGARAKQPPELERIIDPPPPEFITGYAEEVRAAKRARWLKRLGLVAAVVILCGVLAAVWAQSRVKTTYFALVVDQNVTNTLPEEVAAANLAAQAWNDNEATSQQQIEIVPFSDGGDPQRAKQVAEQIVADGRFMGVIGHDTSPTSLAAAPIYEAAGMPAITPSATADAVTENRPWYFRTVYNNSHQGDGMALYAIGAEEAQKVVTVYTDDSYGQSIRDGFVETFEHPSRIYDGKQKGKVVADILMPATTDPDARDATLVQAAKKVAEAKDATLIVLATSDPQVTPFFRELDRLEVDKAVIVPDALAQLKFFDQVARADPQQLDRTFAATPLNAGTLVGPSVQVYDDLGEQLGYQPGWTAGLTYDAVQAFTEALRRGEGVWGTGSLPEDREAIKTQLNNARDPGTAFNTATGLLWFNADNSAQRTVAYDSAGITNGGRTIVTSAPFQVSEYTAQAGVSLDEQIATGWAFQVDDRTFTVQRVVTTGFNINEITDLDPATQTFVADFFIWLKFEGGAGLPSQLQFVNAVDPTLTLGEPERVSTTGSEEYQLYRVKSTFSAPMSFNDFPFDQQTLPITVQNRTGTAARITYVTDPDNMEQSQADRLMSGTDANATIDEIPNWQSDSVLFYPTSVGNTGALGDPSLDVSDQGVTFSQVNASIQISRDVGSFLIKNLLPLLLLTIVTYVSLWYPYKDAPARVTFGVTGILTGAVMLNSVTSSLPQVDYNVAIEWAYYAFILLAAICIVITLVGRHLFETRQLARVRTLDVIARVGYPLYVFAIFLAYWFAFT